MRFVQLPVKRKKETVICVKHSGVGVYREKANITMNLDSAAAAAAITTECGSCRENLAIKRHT